MTTLLDLYQSRYFVKSDNTIHRLSYGDNTWNLDARGWWSRIYEYAWVIDVAKSINPNNKTAINFAAGSKHPNILFDFKSITATDIFPKEKWLFKHIDYKKADLLYDFVGKFDFACCISTLEHIEPKLQAKALKNMCEHINPNGCLLLTFDMPGFDYPTDLDLYKKVLVDNNMTFQQSDVADEIVTTRNSPIAKQSLKDMNLSCYRIFAQKISI